MLVIFLPFERLLAPALHRHIISIALLWNLTLCIISSPKIGFEILTVCSYQPKFSEEEKFDFDLLYYNNCVVYLFSSPIYLLIMDHLFNLLKKASEYL